jgi:hypothetical protein
MILIAAANYLKEGVVQRRFAANPIIAKVLPLLATENFFDRSSVKRAVLAPASPATPRRRCLTLRRY